MGVRAEIVDFNRWFETLERPPVIVNNFNISTDESREELNKLIYTHYEGDSLGIAPQCRCGNLHGEFQVGNTCDQCHTEVRAVTEKPLEPVLWVAAPTGVDTLINPKCWVILSKALSYGPLNILEHLCNPNATLPANPPKVTQRYLQLKIPRGINYFYQHFDDIMAILYDAGLIYANKPKAQRDILMAFVKQYRHAIFAKYLPCPSRVGLITEKTVTSTYTEHTTPLIQDAILTISNVENSTRPLSIETRQARATEAIKKFVKYHEEVQRTVLFKKEGWSRKHLFGTRSHWTFRGVITSLSENHERDELHIPWSMAVMLFEYHLMNGMLKRNFTPTECVNTINESVLQYNPFIDELFDELIKNAPQKGIPCLWNRNPYLCRDRYEKS